MLMSMLMKLNETSRIQASKKIISTNYKPTAPLTRRVIQRGGFFQNWHTGKIKFIPEFG